MIMKPNNFITLLLVLPCIYNLGPCTCTAHVVPNDNTVPETTQSYRPESAPEPAFSFPSSGSPYGSPRTSEQYEINSGRGGGSNQAYTSFSAAFSEILKGSLRGNTMIIPEKNEDKSEDDKNDPPSNNHQSVKQICAHTDYPDICFSTISPLVPRNHFDVMKVLEGGIQACYFQTNFTISTVVKHMASSPELAAALSDCKEQYSNALENLQKAIDAIPSRDIGTITVRLSAVMADVSACESGFEDLKTSSPLGNSEGLVTITASNCLAIASLIPY